MTVEQNNVLRDSEKKKVTRVDGRRVFPVLEKFSPEFLTKQNIILFLKK
jgi:hypothetical protein